MKRSDLHRKWAWVIDMCEGTTVDPTDCLRIYGLPCHTKNLCFGDDPKYYTFAVAILEGQPLFVGDEVYWKSGGKNFNWDNGLLSNAEHYQEYLTRTPKRTITLNGEKLPAPDGKDNDGFSLLITGVITTQHCFKSSNDRRKVENAINKLLRGE